MENRMNMDYNRVGELEAKLREAQSLVHEAETRSEEVFISFLSRDYKRLYK